MLHTLLYVLVAAVAIPTLCVLAAALVKTRLTINVLQTTITFWRTFIYFFRGGSYATCPYFTGNAPQNVHARVHVHSLWLIFYLWSKPHYRNGTFRDDMIKNLRNVAVPGTGLPLSVVVRLGRIPTMLYILLSYPAIALIAALRSARVPDSERGAYRIIPGVDISEAFRQQLLYPNDWFSYWRLNCRLASYHALVTGETGYECEDKWTFLTRCEESGIPISPCMHVPALICKHRNEEGGLGFHAFKNATVGGDWIIQEALTNAQWLADLLPKVAPLSTMRVITSSSGGLQSPVSEVDVDRLMKTDMVKVCSTVLRAGRSGAITDHVSVLFDIDPKTGVVKHGTSSAHWYQLGPTAIATTPWLSKHDVGVHPDNNVNYVGYKIPEFQSAVDLVKRAHLNLSPGVPMIGWDVAFTNKGVLLLEANYSCNFFRGTFDEEAYIRLVNQYMVNLEERRVEGKSAFADRNSQCE